MKCKSSALFYGLLVTETSDKISLASIQRHREGGKMLPLVTVFPAEKQNSEIPRSSHLKSRPKGGSVIEGCCEVFLSKRQQDMTINSNQITS